MSIAYSIRIDKTKHKNRIYLYVYISIGGIHEQVIRNGENSNSCYFTRNQESSTIRYIPSWIGDNTRDWITCEPIAIGGS